MQTILNITVRLVYYSLVMGNICYILTNFLGLKIVLCKLQTITIICLYLGITGYCALNDNFFISVIQIIIVFILPIGLYRKNILRIVYVTFFYLVMEIIVQVPIIFLLNNRFNFHNNYSMSIAISITSSCIILLLCILIHFKFSRFDTAIDLISAPIKFLILICLCAICVLMEGITAPIIYKDKVFNVYQLEVFSVIAMLTIVSVIVCLLINTVSSKYYQNISKALSKQIDIQVKYYDSLRKSNEQIHRFKHDFKNHILCIQNLLSQNQIDDANKYINELSGYTSSEEISFNTGNHITNGLLTDKNNIAMEQGIKINFDGIVPSNGITAVDLCIIFSNALDNAIEACVEIDDVTTKIIEVETKIHNDNFFIKIINPTLHNISIKGNSIVTTKDDKSIHGFGLYNVNDVIKKYSGEMTLTSESNQFIFDAYIKLNSTIA